MSAEQFTVVIDAGHGGKDPGAIGTRVREKDLNLDVALRLEKLLKANQTDVKVVMTRRTDVFLTLQERANIVNKHNADLFICIHTNSAQNKQIKGAETFTLGLDKMQSNLEVAMRENAVMKLEDNYQTRYEGFDPNSVESYIMFEFMQDKYIDKSLQYASLVQEEFGKIHRSDRGVRQAAFWVLHKSACPSVLIEMGFISNPDEEKYLSSDKGKDEIAKSIYNAFTAYRNSNKGKAAVADNNSNKETTQKVTPKQDEKPQEQAKPSTETKPESKPQVSTKSDDKQLPVFRVQIFAVKNQLREGDPSFKGLQGCKFTVDGKFYKYTYGEERDYDKIVELQRTLSRTFDGCFVVAFLNGKQIAKKDALKLIENQQTK